MIDGHIDETTMQNDIMDRLIELLEEAEGQVNNDVPSLKMIADHLIENDVVPVVRCKDCKYRYAPTRCALWYGTVNDQEYFVERGEDFYCSYGERK